MTSPYAIALSHFAPFGSRTYVKLFGFYHNEEAIWNATSDELTALGLQPKTIDSFLAFRQRTDIPQLVASLDKLNIATVDRNDSRFPAALKTIHDPPIILYVRGTLPSTDQLIGIVGSREATEYGTKTARRFSQELSQAGLLVVSGLARGIDTEAHEGALSVGKKTVAVLAHGLEQLHGEKRSFAQRIIDQGGAIISEQPPYFKAEKFHFPIRNRIIAGMSRGVVIVEAAIASGTLRTAQCAIDAHREVFAIPGPIDSITSEGANKLLQDGAHVTMSPNDVLLALGLPARPPLEPIIVPTALPTVGAVARVETVAVTLSPEQATVLAQLSAEPKHTNDIAREAGLSTGVVLGALTILEIHGKVRSLGNQHYCL